MPLTNDKKTDSDIKMRMSEYFFCRISSDLSHASAYPNMLWTLPSAV